MMSLKNSSSPPLTRNSSFFGWLLALSFVGFTDAAYLTIKHYVGGPLPCRLFSGCETVTTSWYATIFGLPVALFGALYYLTIFIGLITAWDSRPGRLVTAIFGLTIIGFAFSLWLLVVQVFILKALCLYCLISAATSSLLFLLSWRWYNRHRAK